MKTNIVNIHGKYVVKTGKVFVYEGCYNPVFDEDGALIGYEDFSFSEEIIDVCTGEHYAFDGIIHLIGNPYDAYTQRRNSVKRGKHSFSNNKRAARSAARGKIIDDLPF